MGLNFKKRVKIGNGVNLNLSKKGVSTSFKAGNTTLNTRGRMTTSAPGTGLSYSSNINSSSKKATAPNSSSEKTIKNIIIGVMIASVGMTIISKILGVTLQVFGWVSVGIAIVAMIKAFVESYWGYGSIIGLFGICGLLSIFIGRFFWSINKLKKTSE